MQIAGPATITEFQTVGAPTSRPAAVGDVMPPGSGLQLGPYPGDSATVRLPGGSTVRLTGPAVAATGRLGARLSFGFGGNGSPPAAIVLSLFGPARLQVAPGTRLRVRVGTAEVTAEGPAVFSTFWMSPNVPDATVSVSRGAVVVSGGEGTPSGPTRLAAGQSVFIHAPTGR
ncbi:MAG TPA: hypothetical protein VFD49_00410 [Candidatus Dormibacteraeota bacterium]|nr:hypothetical protein [Candidatus Dormibacteraeota bacterium]